MCHRVIWERCTVLYCYHITLFSSRRSRLKAPPSISINWSSHANPPTWPWSQRTRTSEPCTKNGAPYQLLVRISSCRSKRNAERVWRDTCTLLARVYLYSIKLLIACGRRALCVCWQPLPHNTSSRDIGIKLPKLID